MTRKPATPDEKGEALEFLLFSGRYDEVVERTAAAPSPSDMPEAIGALALSGRLDEARSAFSGFVRESPDVEARTRARFFLVAGFCHAGQQAQAMRMVRASLADLPHTTGRTRFWIWQGLALARYFEGRFDRARAAGRRALSTAMQASFSYARVLSLDLLAHILAHRGEVHAGLRLLSQAASLAQRLGYRDNEVTLRTSAVVLEAEYLVVDVETAIERVESAVATPEVSYFTRRNGLIVLATLCAVRGDAARATSALDEARKIALPGSDRRGKTRWFIARALATAVARGSEAARSLFEEARAAADGQLPLLAELGFVEAFFYGSDELRKRMPAIAKQTRLARAELAADHIAGRRLPDPAATEDGFARALLMATTGTTEHRLGLLIEKRCLGLIPRAMDLEPWRRLILFDGHLIGEEHGTVVAGPAPSGPSRRVLLALGGGYRSRPALANEVWGLGRYDPVRHSAVINTAMSRLRSALPTAEWVVTDDDGYHLAAGVELVALGAEVVATESVPPPPGEDEPIVEKLRRDGPCSTADIASALKVSASSALRILRRMTEDGRIERTGSGRATRYRLVDP